MKLPIISIHNLKSERGFLLPEIIISFTLMSLFITTVVILSATMSALHVSAEHKLNQVRGAVNSIATSTSRSAYGNDTFESSSTPLTTLTSNYSSAWGRNNCNARLKFNPERVEAHISEPITTTNNPSTDLEVRNGVIYLTTDSSTVSLPDLYIIDGTTTLSSINTGPGLSALEVAGYYIYAANLGSTNQLQIIDILNRSNPIILTRYKLPLPNASSTAPSATSIFFSENIVYLGTQKWEGREFAVIDVSNPSQPQYLGGFETNTLINDIYVRDGYAYIAASDSGQMRILDVHNPSNITQVASFSPSGWETQTGRTLSYFEGMFLFGRTTGGFNLPNNHEFFLFPTSTSISTDITHDIPGGVYGILKRSPYTYFATKFPGREFQIWKEDFSNIVYEKSLGFLPQAMTCDRDHIYFATGDERGWAILNIH